MKKRFVIFVFLLIIQAFVVFSAQIDENIDDALEENSTVRVIVKLRADSRAEIAEVGRRVIADQVKIGALSIDKEELKHRQSFRSSNGFSAEITEAGLEKLRNNPAVESVVIDEPVHALLTDTVPLINANDLWLTQLGGINISGVHQSICIIDTGVNYTHESLGGCNSSENINTANCSKVLSGYDFVSGDDDPNDDNGHGTHVAGIAAGNGTVTGVAPRAQIIALKVLDENGTGFVADIISAIEWCTYNATKFNITAISMSLGGSALYSNHCDSSEGDLAAAVNAAVAKNISVIAAAGNSDDSNSLSSPACLFNVTSVGSTSKSDSVSSFSNAGTILDLLAPGELVNSTRNGSGTSTLSGTSMSAPHAAGAVALLRQYYQLMTSTSALSSDIEHSLKISGVPITDTRSGRIYSRVDVLAALNYINASPLVSFVSPTPNNGSSAGASFMVNITSDKELFFATLEFNGTNYTMTQGNATNFYYTLSSLAERYYSYTIYANTTTGKRNVTSRNVRIDLTGPNVTFVAPTPLNQTYNTTNIIVVNITLDENASVAILEFSGVNQTMNGTGMNWSATAEVSDGNYTFRVYANDTLGNLALSSTRFVAVNTIVNRTSIVTVINSTSNGILRLLRGNLLIDSSNISLVQNYTLEFNLSGAFIQVADFSWNGANTSGIVNVTTIVANDSVFGNVTAIGGTLNATYWVEMNSFVSSFVPIVVFDKVYRVFYYMNGTTNSPVLTRVASVCAAGFTNRPCYLTNSGNSSVYLMSFSGASAGSDVEAPQVTIVSPAAGVSLSSTSLSLAYVARDNAAVESCFYSLNSGSNTTISNCANTTITAAEGSNTLILYVNDTSGQLNSSSVAFTVTVSSGGSGGSGGGGGGGGGGGSSSGGKKRVVAAPVPIISEESAPAAGGVSTAAVPHKVCETLFESFSASLVTEDSVKKPLKFTSTCTISDLSFSSTLSDVSITGNLHSNNIELDLQRIGSVSQRLPAVLSSITGGAIGLSSLTSVVQRYDAVKMVEGTLTIKGKADGKEFVKDVPITVTLFAVEKATKPLAFAGTGILVVSASVILSGVYLFRRFRMKRI